MRKKVAGFVALFMAFSQAVCAAGSDVGVGNNNAVSREAVMIGDVDGNGTINLTDAQLALKGSLKVVELEEWQKAAADVDGKDGVTLNDAQRILKRALGIITSLVVDVEGIVLEKTETTIRIGGSVALQAQVLPENATSQKIAWSSSDEQVAKVSDTGIITGVATGEAVITATSGACSKSCKVTVVDAAETTIADSEYYTSLGFDKECLDEKIPAFLGADGFGKYSIGGRGGRVIEVTNLNDSGEGSLRAAVEAEGPRVVVFKVSGTIYLENKLTIRNPYLTIAGETAPGDGICISNYGPTINTHDVIVRYLRCRPGGSKGTDALWINSSQNVIVDHLSTSWGTDETLSVSDSNNVSVQYCMITESLNQNNFGTHGMGSLIRGSRGQRVTYHNNVYATHRSRLPMAGNYTSAEEDPVGFNVEFINNVIYNWSGRAAGKNHDNDPDTVTHFNLINNYYKKGRSSQGSYMWSQSCGASDMYASGNMMDGKTVEDQKSLVEFEDDGIDDNEPTDWSNFWKSTPFAFSSMGHIKNAEKAYNELMKDAGASLSRDCIDTAVIQTIIDNTGKKPINKPEQSAGWNGQWPVLESTEPYEDLDHDGMDDEWEDFSGLDSTDSTDGAAVTPSGYTNLEIFLEYLIQNHDAY